MIGEVGRLSLNTSGVIMNLINLTETIRKNKDFLEEIENLSNENIRDCYQCGKCTAGCPVAFEMDYTPRQMMRMLQVGLKEEALKSSSIWLCASCVTCTARCPREVDFSKIMASLRLKARREGYAPIENLVHLDMCFLSNMYGRISKIQRPSQIEGNKK